MTSTMKLLDNCSYILLLVCIFLRGLLVGIGTEDFLYEFHILEIPDNYINCCLLVFRILFLIINTETIEPYGLSLSAYEILQSLSTKM